MAVHQMVARICQVWISGLKEKLKCGEVICRKASEAQKVQMICNEKAFFSVIAAHFGCVFRTLKHLETIEKI